MLAITLLVVSVGLAQDIPLIPYILSITASGKTRRQMLDFFWMGQPVDVDLLRRVRAICQLPMEGVSHLGS
jgi:hypothetical protein